MAEVCITGEYFAFQVHITDTCDQRCRHCYIFAEDTAKPVHAMNWDQMQIVVDNACSMCDAFGREPCFYVTGGDPILHPHFWDLLALLKGRGIPCTVMGNPFHLTQDVCLRLRDNGCGRYQLSLDGMRQTHDWFRKPGSFDATFEAIRRLQSVGIRTVVMTTVSGANIHEVPNVVDAVAAARVDVFAFARYCPTSEDRDTGMTPSEYRELLVQCEKRFRAHEAAGCPTYFNRKDHLWTLLEYETGAFVPPFNTEDGLIYGGCNCGNSHLTILPNGDVLACRRVPDSRVGSAFTDQLADLWLGAMEAYREYDSFAKCSQCELLAWCRGCPAVARGANGSFYAADPHCWKDVPVHR